MMTKINAINPAINRILDNIEMVMIGKRDTAILSLVALLAEGHVLLEDVPGVGKTMLVRTIAKSVSADFKRIQFTPDLLPSDITGVSIYNPKTMEFEFRPGPLMGNIVLADEINRTSPKTQAALLEGMGERSVTVDGDTKLLKRPFFVMATQNPIEYEGTYPLPEAQLDRFMFKLKMGYPSMEEELDMLNRTEQRHPIEDIKPVMQIEELIELQKEVKQVYVDDLVKHYILDIIGLTRSNPSIYLGVSPRGSLTLMKAAQALAFVQDRDFVIPDDIKYLAPSVLSHRILLNSEAKFEGVQAFELMNELVSELKIPNLKVKNAR